MLRCGIYEPHDKIYVKNIQEFYSIDMGRLLAIVLISQLPKLQICFTTGIEFEKKTKKKYYFLD